MTATAEKINSEKNPLQHLHKLLKSDMEQVNHTILKRVESGVPMIPHVARYIIAAGGKRLRPILTLASANLCGYKGDHHIKLAAAVEFIHTATLLHDDVVDESELRRGRPTANEAFGNQTSILVGDFLFTRAFQLMVESQSLPVLDTLANASAQIVEGEVMQLSNQGNVETAVEDYLKVVEAKTAALFSAACSVGGMIASADEKTVKALYDYGYNLGVAFQIADDVLDYSADQERLGKTIGDDFREGKVTLPVVLAYRDGEQQEQAFWRKTMADYEQEEGDLQTALSLIERHNALEESLNMARNYGMAASAALSCLPDNELTETLVDLVEFSVSRAS